MPSQKVVRRRRLLMLLSAMALLLAGMVAWASQSAWLLGRVREEVSAAVTGSMAGGRMRLGGLSGSLWGPLELSGIALEDGSGVAVVKVAKVRVNYRILPLLNRRLVVTELAVEGFEADGVIEADGGLNFGRLLKPSAPSAARLPVSVSVQALKVEGSSLSIRDGRNGLARVVALRQLALSGAATVSRDRAAAFELERLGLRWRVGGVRAELPLELRQMSLLSDASGLRAVVSRLAVSNTELFGFRAQVTPATEAGAPFGRVEISLPKGNISPELAAELVPGLTLRGPLQLSARVGGPASRVGIHLEAASVGEPVVFDGWVDLRDAAMPRYGGSLVAQHLRPQEWIALPGPGSNLTARLLVEGAGFAASTMKARVELDVGPSLLAGLPLERAYGNITVQQGRAVVTDLSAAALGGELDGSGSIDQEGRVAVHLRAAVPDVASAEPWVPRSVGRLSGRAELRLDAEALLPLTELSLLAKRSPQQLWEQLGPELKVAMALRGDRLAAGDRQVGRVALLVNKAAGAEVPLDASLQLEQVQVGGLREGRAKLKARLVARELDLTVSGGAAGGLSLELAAGASLAEEEVAVRLRSFSAARGQLAVNLVGEGRANVALADGLRPVGFSLAPLQLAVGPGVVEASGSWEESGALTGRLSAKKVDLRALGLALADQESVADFAGFLDLDAGLGGSLSAPTAQLKVGLSELSARGLGPYGAKLTANYAPGRMRAEFGLSEGDAARLAASCELPVTVDIGTGQLVWSARRPMEAHWKLEPLALAPFAAAAGLPLTEVAGSLRGEGTVRGRLDALDVTGALTGEGLAGTVSQHGVAVRFEGIKTTAGVAYVAAGTGEPSVQARAEVEWQGRRTATLSTALAIDLRAALRDPVKAPAMLTAAKGDFSMKLEPFDVALLPGSLRKLLGLVGGTIGGSLRWDNRAGRPVLEATGEVEALVVQGLEAVDGSLSLMADRGTELAASVSYGGAPLAEVDGSIAAPLAELLDSAVRATRPLELRAQFEPVSLARLGLVVPALRTVSGTASGYLDVTGNLVAPRLRGRAVLRGLSSDESRRADVGVEFSATSAKVEVSGTVCGEQTATELAVSSPLSYEVSWNVPNGAWMNFLVKGERPEPLRWPMEASLHGVEVPLASVASNALLGSQTSDLVGLLTADLQVSGSMAAPLVEGAASVTGLGVTLAALHRRVENATAEVVFEPGKVELRQLSVQESGSSLRATGQVLLAGGQPTSAKLSVALKNFLVTAPKGTAIFVTAKVEAAASRASSGWTASTVIRDSKIAVPEYANAAQYGPTTAGAGVFFVGEDVAKDQVGKRKPALLADASGSSMGGASVPIRLHVETTGSNRVEHTYADLEYKVGLDVTIEGDSIVPVGTVTLPEGTVRFAGKSFAIRRGLISFDGVGENPMDAVLDIQAAHTLSAQVAANLPPATSGSPNVTLAVTGTASAPVVRFASDPAMPQEDVLFVLLTGRPIAREESASGDAVAAQQQALATAGSLFIGLLSDRLPGVGVDSLTIESDAQTGRAVSRVEGGKYIAENLFVSGIYIPQAAEDENDFEVALDWIVVRLGADSLRLTLRGGNLGNGGLELLYNMLLQ
jgi:autotransporter translocation and assembly factor TamB